MGFETLALVAVAGSTVMSGISSYQQGQSQEAINKYNAKVSVQEATARKQSGQLASQQEQERTQRLLSAQVAGYGKAGVTMEGTPLVVQIKTAERAAFDDLVNKYNTEVGVGQSLSEAELYRKKGNIASRAGLMGAGASLFSGITDMAKIKMMA